MDPDADNAQWRALGGQSSGMAASMDARTDMIRNMLTPAAGECRDARDSEDDDKRDGQPVATHFATECFGTMAQGRLNSLQYCTSTEVHDGLGVEQQNQWIRDILSTEVRIISTEDILRASFPVVIPSGTTSSSLFRLGDF